MGRREPRSNINLMTRPIRTDSAVPVYVQIADYIAADIKAGRLKPSYPIPSETAMVQEWGVARDTARNAVKLLRERELVVTIAHRGTFVLPLDAEVEDHHP